MGLEKSKRVKEALKTKGLTSGKTKTIVVGKDLKGETKEGRKEEKKPYERRDSGITESSFPGSMYRGRYSTATYGVAQFGTQTIEMREHGAQTDRTRQKGVDKLIPMCDYRDNTAQTLCHMEVQTVPQPEILPEKCVAIQTLPYDEGGPKVEEVSTQTYYEEVMGKRLYSDPDYQDPFAYDDKRFLVSAASRHLDKEAKLRTMIIRPKTKTGLLEETEEGKKNSKKRKKDKTKGEQKKRKGLFSFFFKK